MKKSGKVEENDTKRPPLRDQPQSAFARFAELAKRLIRVPKSEVSRGDSTSDPKMQLG